METHRILKVVLLVGQNDFLSVKYLVYFFIDSPYRAYLTSELVSNETPWWIQTLNVF